jgi:eukaryotic-like serine/threonine-protein kinase
MSVDVAAFLDGIRSLRLLDDSRLAELQNRPESHTSDLDGLANYAQNRGWLTAFQIYTLREGRGSQLAVGNYRLVDQISETDSGWNYLALHPALPNPVAVRLVRHEWLAPADEPVNYLFRAQSACLANSLHLANVLDAGVHEGRTFVVQEYVDGCDLFHLVNEMGAMPVGLACEYTRQGAVALQAAHEKSIAHGHLTPYTALLSPVKRVPDAASGYVSVRPRPGATIKLTDCGLAARRPSLQDMTYGQTDLMGPVGFAPPERLTSGVPDMAGDLYGLGATLYFLLAGRAPHDGTSPVDILLSLQQNSPVPIESLRNDVPPAVADLIGRLLSRDPAARPSAAEAASHLKPYSEPSAIPDPTPPSSGSAIPVASETFTHANLPMADTVMPGEGISAPTIEPMPEIHPLEDHHDEGFGHGGMSSGPSTSRPKAKPKKSLTWVFVGLALHGSAVLLIVAYVAGWFNSTPAPETKAETKSEKKEIRKDPPKKKKNPDR